MFVLSESQHYITCWRVRVRVRVRVRIERCWCMFSLSKFRPIDALSRFTELRRSNINSCFNKSLLILALSPLFAKFY